MLLFCEVWVRLILNPSDLGYLHTTTDTSIKMEKGDIVVVKHMNRKEEIKAVLVARRIKYCLYSGEIIGRIVRGD